MILKTASEMVQQRMLSRSVRGVAQTDYLLAVGDDIPDRNRNRVANELYETEKDYLTDLQVCSKSNEKKNNENLVYLYLYYFLKIKSF